MPTAAGRQELLLTRTPSSALPLPPANPSVCPFFADWFRLVVHRILPHGRACALVPGARARLGLVGKGGGRVARPARKSGCLPVGRRHGNAAKMKDEHKKAKTQNFPKVWAISHLGRLFCR